MPLSSVLGWARPSDGPFFLYFLSLQPLPGLAALQACVHSSSWIPLHHFPSPSFSLGAPGSGIPWLPFSWFTPSFWWNTPLSSFLRKNVLEINVWQNCMSGKVFILSSVLIGSLSGCRILGSRSFSLKIWKALLCFLLVSCVTLEDIRLDISPFVHDLFCFWAVCLRCGCFFIHYCGHSGNPFNGANIVL